MGDSEKNSIDLVAQTVSDSAKHINAFTVAFITLLAYVALATASIDHASIFLNTKVTPPPFSAEVPLVQFSFVAATIVLLVHAYILLNLALIESKLRIFCPALISPDHAAYPIVWLLMPRVTDHARISRKVIFSLYVIVYILAPLATLFTLHLKLLPAHRPLLTSAIMFMLIIDAVAICLGLPIPVTDRGSESSRKNQSQKRRLLFFGGLMFFIDKNRRLLLVTLSVFLLLMYVAVVNGSRSGCADALWGVAQRNLRVTPSDLVDYDGPLNLAGRDFRCGDFAGVDLSQANFQGADLRNATFSSALLRNASFLPAGISARRWQDWDETRRRTEIERIQAETCLNQEPDGPCPGTWHGKLTRLDGVDFANADLTGATVALAMLRNANLDDAKLVSADLSGAFMQDARLNRAEATWKAELFMAQMDGIQAHDADFSRANLREVSAIGASLLAATLEEARLDDSNLAAATLVDVKARGAIFAGSNLVGADLRGAELIGVKDLNLETVVATHADLSEAKLEPTTQPPLWADLRNAKADKELFEAVGSLRDLDGAFDASENKILLSSQGTSGLEVIDQYYDYIAHGLRRERERHVGLASEGYLEKALEEIARGERVPRIRALERSLQELGFGQDIACTCMEAGCTNSPIQGSQGDIFTGLTKKTVETQFEKSAGTHAGTDWTCVVPTKVRGERGPKGCFCAENCGGGGIGAGPNVVHLGLTQEKIDKYYRVDAPDNPTGWLCGNYRGTVE